MRSVRTNLSWVWRKLTTFMLEKPRRTIWESLLEIIRKFRSANRQNMDFSHAIQTTSDDQKSNATQSPKLGCLVGENNEGKRVYRSNLRRNRTKKNDVETMLVCGPSVIHRELDVPKYLGNY